MAPKLPVETSGRRRRRLQPAPGRGPLAKAPVRGSLAELPQLRHEVDRGLPRPAQLEGAGVEVVLVGLGHVDLDPAEEGEVSAAELVVDHLEHRPLHHAVRLVGERGHGILGGRDRRGHCPDLRLHEIHLQVVRRPAARGRPAAASRRVVRADHGPARGRWAALSSAEALAHLSVCGDSDVGPESDEDMAVGGHVAREGREASLAGEGRSADATHREDIPPVVLHEHGHAAGFAVDLVGAEGRAKQRAIGGEAVLLQHANHTAVHRLAWQGPGEVPVEGLVDWSSRRRAPGQPREDLAL
mmetsp:Transcript_61893/g.164569  ORF Transcript_61893/g.164569 Transcript_61893/m.164569 type:complete len:299 (-) Transcript_61893:326-1222(-)